MMPDWLQLLINIWAGWTIAWRLRAIYLTMTDDSGGHCGRFNNRWDDGLPDNMKWPHTFHFEHKE